MNTRQLQYVIKVAEERSFSAAAKKLYIAQPSLSQFISKLEKEIGYELFDRTAAPLRLTAEGEVYVETAREILNLEWSMEKRLRDMNQDQFGKLSVGISPYNGSMPLVLKRFFSIFPHYKVEIYDVSGTEERLTMLERGKLDMCVQAVYTELDRKFVVEEIGTDDLLLVVPSVFPINENVPVFEREGSPYPEVDLRMFRDLPFVAVDDNMRLGKTVNSIFAAAGIQPNIKATCHKSEDCLAMVAEGIGVTIVQHSLIKYSVNDPRVRNYTIGQDHTKNKVAIVYARNRYLSKAARGFINVLKSL